MKKHSLYDGITEESLTKMLRCFSPELKHYLPEEVVLRYSNSSPKIGLIQRGSAQLQRLDSDGNFNLLETYEKNDLFGEPFYLPLENFEYFVTAQQECEIIFISYDHAITPCQNVCKHHSQFIRNLFLMTAERAQSLSLHLNILSQATTRKKLLAYLKYMQGVSGTNPVHITISRSELAEYLCVDRSAMTREIRKMEEDGVLKASRKEFLLY